MRVRDIVGAGTRGLEEVVVDEVDQVIAFSATDEDVVAYIERFIRSTRKMQRKLRRKTLFETKSKDLVVSDVDQALDASGDLYPIGGGLCGLNGQTLRLLEFFESEFRNLAAEFSAGEQRYPVMLPIELLEELHYFSHFPNQVTFCSHLPEDLPLLDGVARASEENEGLLPM